MRLMLSPPLGLRYQWYQQCGDTLPILRMSVAVIIVDEAHLSTRKKRTIHLLQNRTILFASNTAVSCYAALPR